MVYDLTFTAEANLLRVEIHGERPKENLSQASKEAWVEISRVAIEREARKLLVVSYATGDYPALTAYQVNSSLAECGVQKGWQIAFVNMDKKSFKDVKFAETVAVNRGFSVGIFANESDARNWLATPGDK